MSIAWYIVPYKRNQGVGALQPGRYCAMDDNSKRISDSGGNWTETEILGNRAIVKVRASNAVLAVLNTEYRRLPKNRLDDSLSGLPSNVKIILKNELLDMGYNVTEIQGRFGNDIGQFTLRDVLKFATKRRLKPRYDAEKDEIICDGIEQKCRSIESVNSEVQ